MTEEGYTNSFECLCTLLRGTQQDTRRPLQVAQLFVRLGIILCNRDLDHNQADMSACLTAHQATRLKDTSY
jgi:hypothetical protein